MPINCPVKKYGTELGAIPVNVSVKIRDIVTIGLAKEVDDVNQYPAVIKRATAVATEPSSLRLTNSIVKSNPPVAIISLTKSPKCPDLGGCLDISRIDNGSI